MIKKQCFMVSYLMWIRFLSIILLITFTVNANAVDLKKRLNKKIDKIKSEKINEIDEYVSNLVGQAFGNESIQELIPGQGLTEVSIQLRESYKPDFSILAVRELYRNNNGNTFLQVSLFNTEVQNEERFTGNFGLGKRFLSNDKFLMTGFNTFLDYDNYGNTRGSIGGELKNATFGLTSNYYKKIKDGTDSEKVLDGYDVQLTSQIPYLHWANVFVNHYKWYGVERSDIEGRKYGSELSLLPSFNLEVAYDDKTAKGLEDEYYVKLNYVYPPRERIPTALDGVSKEMWVKKKDMTDQLLTKVRRQNKIMVELSGAATVSRLD
jgi:hypothetical protein